MSVPDDRRYTQTHEWVRMEDGLAQIGITDYAQHEMGDIVFVELPEPDNAYEQGEPLAVIESVKAVSNIYAPVHGAVVEVNKVLEEVPEALNQMPFDTEICALKCDTASQYDELMSAQEYMDFLLEEQG